MSGFFANYRDGQSSRTQRYSVGTEGVKVLVYQSSLREGVCTSCGACRHKHCLLVTSDMPSFLSPCLHIHTLCHLQVRRGERGDEEVKDKRVGRRREWEGEESGKEKREGKKEKREERKSREEGAKENKGKKRGEGDVEKKKEQVRVDNCTN